MNKKNKRISSGSNNAELRRSNRVKLLKLRLELSEIEKEKPMICFGLHRFPQEEAAFEQCKVQQCLVFSPLLKNGPQTKRKEETERSYLKCGLQELLADEISGYFIDVMWL